MRACIVATRLARSVGLSESEAAVVYYSTLLRSVGCTATSHEYAATFGGDDVTIRGAGDMADPTDPREVVTLLWGVARGNAFQRVAGFAASATRAKAVTREGARADCEVGAQMVRRLGLGPSVEQALLHMFERWDGAGSPRKVEGDAIALPARLAAVAYAWVMFDDAGGPDYARATITRWSGRALDPSLVDAVVAQGDDLVGPGLTGDPWQEVVASEPGGPRELSPERLDDVARAFGDAADLKSPFLHGHSSGVAGLAEAAARAMGLPDTDVVAVRRAALLHDLGRVGVATGIWEKPGPLNRAEWEHVRLHPYHTERILSRAPAFAELAQTAGMHHERLDGSGYHRAAAAATLDVPARVLAAADVFHALTEARPHRAALTKREAARVLEGGHLDRDAVAAVIEAAGEIAAPRPAPFGLTKRELQVLRLLAAGRTEKQIAAELFISASTVHTHVVHVYGKAGVSTRAALAMFAMEHGLVRPGEEPDA